MGSPGKQDMVGRGLLVDQGMGVVDHQAEVELKDQVGGNWKLIGRNDR